MGNRPGSATLFVMPDANDENVESSPPPYSGPGAPVSAFMGSEVVCIAASATVREAARLLADASVGCIVVGSPAQVEAVISERDIVRAVASGVDIDAVTANELGSHQLVWVSADDTVGDVAEEMMEDYIRHVLVRDDTGLVGVISMRDVISAYTF